MSLYDYIQKLDLFSSVVGLRYKGNWRYKTFIGGLVSIIYVLILMTIAIYFMIKYINREDVYMSFENTKNYNPPMLNISRDFNIAVSMRYGNKNILRKEIMDVEFEYVTYNITSDTLTIQKIPIIKCREESFRSTKEQFYSFGLNDSLCIDTNNFTIEGSNINNYYSYIRANFILCSNSTLNNNTCLPWEDIAYIIDTNKPLANLYFLDSTFQPKNSDNFLIQFINNINVNITSGDAKETNVYFSNDELFVEQGYIFNLPDKIYNSYVIQSFRDLVSVRAPDQLISLSFNLMSSKYQSKTYISYLKFSTLLANVGGIIQFLLLIINITVYYINNYYFDSECIRLFYRIHNKTVINQKRRINTSRFFQNYSNISKKPNDMNNEDRSFDENLDQHLKNNPIKTTLGNNFDQSNNINNKSELDQINKKEFTSALLTDVNPKTINTYDKNGIEFYKSSNHVQLLKLNERSSSIPISQLKFEHNKDYKNCVSLSNNIKITQMNDKIKTTEANEKIIKTSVNNKKMIIDFDENDLIKAMFCKCLKLFSKKWEEKFDVYQKLKSVLNINLDISKIVMKLMEVDMLKYLVLDDDQLILSKLIMKPEINFFKKRNLQQNYAHSSFSDYYNSNISEYLKDENFFLPDYKNDMQIYLKSLEKIHNRRNCTEIDRKLLTNIKEIFE